MRYCITKITILLFALSCAFHSFIFGQNGGVKPPNYAKYKRCYCKSTFASENVGIGEFVPFNVRKCLNGEYRFLFEEASLNGITKLYNFENVRKIYGSFENNKFIFSDSSADLEFSMEIIDTTYSRININQEKWNIDSFFDANIYSTKSGDISHTDSILNRVGEFTINYGGKIFRLEDELFENFGNFDKHIHNQFQYFDAVNVFIDSRSKDVIIYLWPGHESMKPDIMARLIVSNGQLTVSEIKKDVLIKYPKITRRNFIGF